MEEVEPTRAIKDPGGKERWFAEWRRGGTGLSVIGNCPMKQDMIWRGKVLTGCAISSGNARLAEVAARVGFDVVWIEMEHGCSDLAGAELSCTAVEAGGGIPLVRTAGWRREHILQALEVKGISGILIGPGDLSANLGAPGDFQNPELIELAARCIRRAPEAGLHAGILAAPGPLLDSARQAGADLCIFATDIGSLVATWQQQLEQWMQCERARPD